MENHKVIREAGQFQLIEDTSAGYPTWYFKNTILTEYTKGKGISYNIDDKDRIENILVLDRNDFVIAAKQYVGNDINSLEVAKSLWALLGDVPCNDVEELDEDFVTPWLTFYKGTENTDVWHWFESHFNLSVAKDLMGLD